MSAHTTDNAPVLGCSYCSGTGGRATCPHHGSSVVEECYQETAGLIYALLQARDTWKLAAEANADAAKTLTEAKEKAERERDALAAALKKYAKHDSDCPVRNVERMGLQPTEEVPCHCVLALEQWKAKDILAEHDAELVKPLVEGLTSLMAATEGDSFPLDRLRAARHQCSEVFAEYERRKGGE